MPLARSFTVQCAQCGTDKGAPAAMPISLSVPSGSCRQWPRNVGDETDMR